MAGRLRVHHDDVTVVDLGPGSTVGELAALVPEPRAASVTALEPTMLLRIDKPVLDELLADRPAAREPDHRRARRDGARAATARDADPALVTAPDRSGAAVRWLIAQTLVFGAMAALLGIVANAMFLDAYGSAWLPATYIAIGAAGFLLSGAIARAARRFDLLGIAVVVLGAAAVAIGASWLIAAGGDGAWVSAPLLVLFPILIQLGFVFVGAQAGRLLDIAGIKASFPRIAAGFSVGAVLGGLLGGQLVSVLGRTEDLLLATAIAQAAFAGLVWATGRRYPAQLRLAGRSTSRAASRDPTTPVLPRARSGGCSGAGSSS